MVHQKSSLAPNFVKFVPQKCETRAADDVDGQVGRFGELKSQGRASLNLMVEPRVDRWLALGCLEVEETLKLFSFQRQCGLLFVPPVTVMSISYLL